MKLVDEVLVLCGKAPLLSRTKSFIDWNKGKEYVKDYLRKVVRVRVKIFA